MANPQPQDVLGRVTLVTGPEEFLDERAIARCASRRAPPRPGVGVLRDDGGLDLTMADARRPGRALAVLRHPLRGRPRPRGPARGVGRRSARLRRGAGRGRRPGAGARRRSEGQRPAHQAAQARDGHRGEVRHAHGPSEFPGFVATEVRAPRGRIDPDAADFLVQAVGQDLRSLAAAASQLASDFPGQPLTVDDGEAVLRRPGRGEVLRHRRRRHLGPAPRTRSRSCAGRSTAARRRCWSPARSPAACAGWPATSPRPRDARRRPGPRGRACRRGSCARMRDQSRGWSDGGMARAIRAVARGRRRGQGRGERRGYALERMVLTVTGRADAR